MKFLILLNGPPSCGKDALANVFKKKHSTINPDVTICKFANSLLDTVFATFPDINLDNYDQRKNLPIGGIFGNEITLRQWMIKYAEEFMKPIFGKSIFGRITCQKITELLKTNYVVFVTDLGKDEELKTIADNFSDKSNLQIIIVRISRPGTSFENDSRNYVYEDKVLGNNVGNIKSIDLVNDSNLDILENELMRCFLSV